MSLMTFFVLATAFCAAVSLLNGVVSMTQGEENVRTSNLLMFQRVGWQALALLFIVLSLFQNFD